MKMKMKNMMKICLFSIGFFVVGQSFGLTLQDKERRPKNFYQIRNIVSKYRKKDLENHFKRFLFSTRPSRIVGSAGHKKTIPYLINTIKKIDSEGKGELTVDNFVPDIQYAQSIYKNDFNREIKGKYGPHDPLFKKWDKFTRNTVSFLEKYKKVNGKNLIWEKRGYMHPDQTIVIGAHYDTIAHNHKTMVITPEVEMPGADDNGSGVVTLLSLIEVLSEVDIPKTVRIVFFDYEELGFLGSKAYVNKYKKTLKKEKFAGYINLEMLGHDSKSKDKEKKYGNMNLFLRRTNVKGNKDDHELAKIIMRSEKKVGGVKFKSVPNSFNSSDHINFWNEGFPAVTLTQNWELDFNPRYHTSNDFYETININTLYKSYKVLTASIISWAFDIIK